MKNNIIRTTAVLLSSLFLCSCIKEMAVPEQNVPTAEIIASIESLAATKTTLDENNNILWSAEDQLIAFLKSTDGARYKILPEYVLTMNGGFSRIDEDSSGDQGTAGKHLDHNIVFYPYSNDVICSGDATSYSLEAILPATQTYAQNTFGNGAFPMVGVSSSAEFSFRNVCGGLKLKFTGSAKIHSIKVEGLADEKISGKAHITCYPDGDTPQTSMDETASKSIVLECNGVQLKEEEPTVFIISIPPVTFSSGMKLTITTTDGYSRTMINTSENTIKRSTLLTFPTISLNVNQADIYIPEAEPDRFDWRDGTYEDLIENVYEPLRARYPEYITRSVIGRDASDTYDIWQYTFDSGHTEQTLYVQSGVHPYEEDAWIGLARVAEMICDNWQTDDRLAYLRQYCRLVIVPVVNVWGVSQAYESRTALNANGVNLNRDAIALTQPENQAVTSFIVEENNRRKISGAIDYHTTVNNEYGDYMLELHPDALNYEMSMAVGRKLLEKNITRRTDEYREKWGLDLYETYLPFFGTVRDNTYEDFCYRKGIPSITCEHSDHVWSYYISGSVAVTRSVECLMNHLIGFSRAKYFVGRYNVTIKAVPSTAEITLTCGSASSTGIGSATVSVDGNSPVEYTVSADGYATKTGSISEVYSNLTKDIHLRPEGSEFRAGDVDACVFDGFYLDMTGKIIDEAGTRTVALDVEPNTDYQFRVVDKFHRFRIGYSLINTDIAIAPKTGSITTMSNSVPGVININSGQAETIYVYVANSQCSTEINSDNFQLFKIQEGNGNTLQYAMLHGYAIATNDPTTRCVLENNYKGQLCVAFNCKPNTSYRVTDSGSHSRFRFYGKTESFDFMNMQSTIYDCIRFDSDKITDQSYTHTFNSGSYKSIVIYLNGDVTPDLTSVIKIEEL